MPELVHLVGLMNRFLSVLLFLLLMSGVGWAEFPRSDPTPTQIQSVPSVEWQPQIEAPVADLLHANLEARDPFQAGQCNFQFLFGYYKKTDWGPGGPPFDYSPFAFRYGLMLTTPCDQHGCWRGNLETLLEINYSTVYGDFGSYLTGSNLLLRYNLVQQECAIVPYIQAGAGFVFTDAWKNRAQDLIGGEFEFLLRGEIGARYMLTEKCSLDAEVGYQHISNATIYQRNGGINNIGFSLGFSYFFGKLD